MMVTWVRGHFKNVRGSLDFDPAEPERSCVEVEIDAAGIWTGEPQRDEHLRSADFLDVARHPKITFRGAEVEVLGCYDFAVKGELTIRGTARPQLSGFATSASGPRPGGRTGWTRGPRSAPASPLRRSSIGTRSV
jgi:polyisoprenoid-binding protein YceI